MPTITARKQVLWTNPLGSVVFAGYTFDSGSVKTRGDFGLQCDVNSETWQSGFPASTVSVTFTRTGWVGSAISFYITDADGAIVGSLSGVVYPGGITTVDIPVNLTTFDLSSLFITNDNYVLDVGPSIDMAVNSIVVRRSSQSIYAPLPAITFAAVIVPSGNYVLSALPTIQASVICGANVTATLPSFANSVLFHCGGDLVAPLPAITASVYCGASVSATLPAIALPAPFYGGGAVNALLPRITSALVCGIAASATLPAMKAVGVIIPSGNITVAQLPGITAQAVCGTKIAATLPALTATGSATVVGLLTASTALPAITAAAQVTAAQLGKVSATLRSITASCYCGTVVSTTIGGVTSSVTATTGAVVQVHAVLPLIQAVADAAAQSHMGVNVLLPSVRGTPSMCIVATLPPLSGVVIGTAVVTATYEAYAVNLKHSAEQPGQVDEVTHYTNFPFTQIVRYKNSYFGVAATGLFLLEGTTDDGAAIPFAARTHVTDFEKTELKTIDSAYFGGRIGPAETITLYAGEETTSVYSYTTPRGATPQNHRQVFGKGLKSRYYALGVSGTGEFELDTVELEVNTLKRRI